MKRIGIVGARKYTNKRKIKEFVYKLKQQFGEDVEIISGGQPKGADGYAKKFALEFDMKYVEFPPRHYQYNQHCILDRNDYGKSYHVVNFFDRNKQIAEYSDYIVAFIPEGYKSNGTLDTISHAEKLKKKVNNFRLNDIYIYIYTEINMRSETKLTSVKIITDLYKRFKGVALNEEFTLQKLVNRSMDKYLKDEEYKKSIVEYDDLQISGSNF